ncbi:hypothetical protein QBC45DRAFT_339410 [Copromyces sp. CBS 386.78]|nr:hypothetical protein QBC45DRAFT_339410 [Copromyces sp. CBS 386.78]
MDGKFVSWNDPEEVTWQFCAGMRATVTQAWQWFFSSWDSEWDCVSCFRDGVSRDVE